MKDDNKARCYILALMSNELQHQHENMKTVRAMITHLQELYDEQNQTVYYEVSKKLFNTKIHDGQSIHDHCLTMIKDLEEFKKLEMTMHKKLQVDLILQFLPSSYD